MSRLGGLNHLLVAGLLATCTHVVDNAAVEQLYLLEDHADDAIQLVGADITQIQAANAYRAAVGHMKARKQMQQRALACAGRTNHGGDATRRHHEADIA